MRLYVIGPVTGMPGKNRAACAFESRTVRDFRSWGEYLDWLKAEYDDGTIRWEDE